ncbi:MAG: hypothetical protein ABW250_05330 [Pyrinomonadaceae bacterium]
MTRVQQSGVPNRVATSPAPPDTESCLATLRGLAGSVAMAEVRLFTVAEMPHRRRPRRIEPRTLADWLPSVVANLTVHAGPWMGRR